MQITARVDYGIRAMLLLAAAAPDSVNAGELSQSQDMPTHFLHGILAALRRTALVRSARGGSGGYKLTRPPEDITVADVIIALDGTIIDIRGIPAAEVTYHGVAVGMHAMWHAAEDAMLTVFRRTTLADLLSNNGNAGAAPAAGVGGRLKSGSR